MTMNTFVRFDHINKLLNLLINIINEDDDGELDPNAILRCYNCEGKYCSDYFFNFKIQIKKVTCNVGEICWVKIKILEKN